MVCGPTWAGEVDKWSVAVVSNPTLTSGRHIPHDD